MAINKVFENVNPSAKLRAICLIYSKSGRPIIMSSETTPAKELVQYHALILHAITRKHQAVQAWVDGQQFCVKLNCVPTCDQDKPSHPRKSVNSSFKPNIWTRRSCSPSLLIGSDLPTNEHGRVALLLFFHFYADLMLSTSIKPESTLYSANSVAHWCTPTNLRPNANPLLTLLPPKHPSVQVKGM